MSYSILKKPVALAGMDPIACLSRGGMPMPTPVPWGGVDIDCQLPGEPPQAASCRSYGGMWYRELGLCVPGTIPGGIPSFPATPYAPAPPTNPYDQVAAQVCTATGGRYAGGICNYPQLGVTRTRSQLVDSEYEPPAGWTPPAGGCPQGQIGWPPVCVPVPNTLPSIPTTPGSCPAGTTWDAASGKCIAPAQLPPPGESESEKQVAPAAPAEEKKLPSWVLPAVAGGAAFVILAALVASQRRSMRANERLTYKVELANKIIGGRAVGNLWGVGEYIDGRRRNWAMAPQEDEQRARDFARMANERSGRMTANASVFGGPTYLSAKDRREAGKLLCKDAKGVITSAESKRLHELLERSMRSKRTHTRARRMRQNPPVELSYVDLNVFQRYWWGQWDPLYAVLSRRGNSVGWVTVDASEEELERLSDVANEIIGKSRDSGEVRTAKAFLKRQK